MVGTDLANDVMGYISLLSPFWLIFGGIIFADLVISLLIKLVKQGKIKL